MKKIATLFVVGILMTGSGVAGADSIPSDSKITAVTVYPGAARVTREAKVNIPTGTHSIVFENIVPVFDDHSLTVAGEGTAKVRIFGGYVKQEYLKEAADKRVKELQEKIEGLQDQVAIEMARIQAINEQKEVLNSVKLHAAQQLPKDLITKMPTTAELSELIKFVGTSREGLEQTNQDVQLKIRALNRDIEKLNSELSQLNSGGAKLKRSIVVDVEGVSAGSLNLRVSYTVNGAYWSAAYDARAALDKSEVELTAFGAVRQTTGEDWDDVQMTLSTAQPTIGGRMPYVEPWILTEYQAYPQRARQNVLMKAAMATADSAVQYEAFGVGGAMPASAPAEERADMAYANVAQAGISVTYQLARPVSIVSDGTESKFPVGTQTLKANFEYSVYPRSSEFAYLGSRVVNSKDLQLLAGPVNLFLNNEFVGKSSIDSIGPGEEFDLYLGIDENVKVKRQLVEKKVDDTLIGGIQSSNRKIIYKYKLSVENFTAKPTPFKLFESMPVAQTDKIKVKIQDVSIAPTAKDWKDRKGVWLWEFNLAPKQKQEVLYTFIVEHPRDMNVGGL